MIGKESFGVRGGEDQSSLGFKFLISWLGSIIRVLRSGVHDILFTRFPIQSKIEVSKKHRPTSLATIENLRSHEISEVFVVANDGNGERRTDEPGAHITKTFDDREEFLVMHVVVDFWRGNFPRVECDRVKFVILIRLLKDPGKGKVGGVGSESARKVRVKMMKNRLRSEQGLELVESIMSGG